MTAALYAGLIFRVEMVVRVGYERKMSTKLDILNRVTVRVRVRVGVRVSNQVRGRYLGYIEQ